MNLTFCTLFVHDSVLCCTFSPIWYIQGRFKWALRMICLWYHFVHLLLSSPDTEDCCLVFPSAPPPLGRNANHVSQAFRRNGRNLQRRLNCRGNQKMRAGWFPPSACTSGWPDGAFLRMTSSPVSERMKRMIHSWLWNWTFPQRVGCLCSRINFHPFILSPLTHWPPTADGLLEWMLWRREVVCKVVCVTVLSPWGAFVSWKIDNVVFPVCRRFGK